MRCECGRFSAGPVCGYCLTGDGIASGVKKPGRLVDVERLTEGESRPNTRFVCGPDGCHGALTEREEHGVVAENLGTVVDGARSDRDGNSRTPVLKVSRSVSVYVIPRVERTGMLCSCGEPEPMVAEIGFWLDTGNDVALVTEAYPDLSAERLIWFRCVACGSVTRETLVPALL